MKIGIIGQERTDYKDFFLNKNHTSVSWSLHVKPYPIWNKIFWPCFLCPVIHLTWPITNDVVVALAPDFLLAGSLLNVWPLRAIPPMDDSKWHRPVASAVLIWDKMRSAANSHNLEVISQANGNFLQILLRCLSYELKKYTPGFSSVAIVLCDQR